MSQKEFDFFSLCFKKLERKIDRLLEIAENAEHGCNEIASLVLELQGKQEKVITISGTKGQTPEERERLARVIKKILLDQSQVHSSRQPPGPTSPEQSQDAGFQPEQPVP